jgi:hypothetical protein
MPTKRIIEALFEKILHGVGRWISSISRSCGLLDQICRRRLPQRSLRMTAVSPRSTTVWPFVEKVG